jgi:hypothetical protein
VEDAGKDGILPAPNSHPANAVHHDGRHFGHGRIYCTTNSQRMSIRRPAIYNEVVVPGMRIIRPADKLVIVCPLGWTNTRQWYK